MISCCSCWSQPRQDATKSCSGITARSLRQLLGAIFGRYAFPARQYSVNGERRSFALLRPASGDTSAQEAIRDAILEAYSRFEAQT
jgi:hypothetical protein